MKILSTRTATRDLRSKRLYTPFIVCGTRRQQVSVVCSFMITHCTNESYSTGVQCCNQQTKRKVSRLERRRTSVSAGRQYNENRSGAICLARYLLDINIVTVTAHCIGWVTRLLCSVKMSWHLHRQQELISLEVTLNTFLELYMGLTSNSVYKIFYHSRGFKMIRRQILLTLIIDY